MQTDRLNQTIRLQDGRVLGFAEAGDPEGDVFFHFHGLYSSRLEVKIMHDMMQKAGIRVIGIDRPGMGLSTYQKERTILGFSADVEALADALGIVRFSLLAVSAGAPYALACSLRLRDRINFCGMVSALPPVEEVGENYMLPESRFFIKVARLTPWLLKPMFWFLHGRFSKRQKDREKFLSHILFYLDDADKRLIEGENTRCFLAEIFSEGYRQGVSGAVEDAILLFAKPWGFRLRDITFSPIRLWHGERDRGVPIEMIKEMTYLLEGAVLKTYLNEGHLSIIFNHLDDILEDIRKIREENTYSLQQNK